MISAFFLTATLHAAPLLNSCTEYFDIIQKNPFHYDFGEKPYANLHKILDEGSSRLSPFRRTLLSFIVAWVGEVQGYALRDERIIRAQYLKYKIKIPASPQLKETIKLAARHHLRLLLKNGNLGIQKAYIEQYVFDSLFAYIDSDDFESWRLAFVDSLQHGKGSEFITNTFMTIATPFVRSHSPAQYGLTPYYAKMLLFYYFYAQFIQDLDIVPEPVYELVNELKLVARYSKYKTSTLNYDFLVHQGFVLGAFDNQVKNLFTSDNGDIGPTDNGADCSTFYGIALEASGLPVKSLMQRRRITVHTLKDILAKRLGHITAIRNFQELTQLTPGDALLSFQPKSQSYHVSIFLGFDSKTHSILRVESTGTHYRFLGLNSNPLCSQSQNKVSSPQALLFDFADSDIQWYALKPKDAF